MEDRLDDKRPKENGRHPLERGSDYTRPHDLDDNRPKENRSSIQCAERQVAGRSCAARRALSEPAADAQRSRMRRPRERHAAACWQHAHGHAGAHSARESKEQPRARLRSLSRALCAWRAIMTVAQALAVACPREGRGTAEPMRLTGRVRKLRGSAHPAPCKPSAHPGPDIRRGSPAHTQGGAAITERA